MSRSIGFSRLAAEANASGRYVCVGLDSDMGRLPSSVMHTPLPQLAFNQQIIDATASVAAAYKPNSAFYEAQGASGFDALAETIAYIRAAAPGAMVILDCKRGDIGSTNRGYAEAAFTTLGADAVTIHPYLGVEAMREFLKDPSLGAFVLCRTSNPGTGEFQDLQVAADDGSSSMLYEVVARHVRDDWNTNRNCGLVVGATYPGELVAIRSIAPELPFLIPGIGAQGGDLAATIEASGVSNGAPTLINSSRGIIFASSGEDFARAAAEAALALHDGITGLLAG